MSAAATPASIVTPRLVLRAWTEADLGAFHALWGDPEVTFWSATHDLPASREQLSRVLARCAGKPWPIGWFALARREDGAIVGNVCLQPAPWDETEIEAGWHVMRAHWGQGYALEAADELIDEAFRHLAPPRIVCSILPSNLRSQRIASLLGFTRYAQDVLRAGLPHDLLERRRPAPLDPHWARA